jgi:hypothetical protein
MNPRECFSIPSTTRDLYRTAAAGFGTIGNIDSLDVVAEGSVWQDFERLTAFIFEKNGFEVMVGTVKTRNRQRRQYDVIARKNGRTLLVECKRWSGSRYRLSALRQAIIRHRERTLFYESVTNTEGVPVLVTLIEEKIRVFEGVPLVPVHRLNAFIGELDDSTDLDFSSFDEADMPDDMPEDPDDRYPC